MIDSKSRGSRLNLKTPFRSPVARASANPIEPSPRSKTPWMNLRMLPKSWGFWRKRINPAVTQAKAEPPKKAVGAGSGQRLDGAARVMTSRNRRAFRCRPDDAATGRPAARSESDLGRLDLGPCDREVRHAHVAPRANPRNDGRLSHSNTWAVAGIEMLVEQEREPRLDDAMRGPAPSHAARHRPIASAHRRPMQ